MWAEWSSCAYETCGDGSKHEIVEGKRTRGKRVEEKYGGKSCAPQAIDGKHYHTELPCSSKNCPGKGQ